MPAINADEIKYYPDRFYVRLDGFDIDNLTSFITDLKLKQEHAIFIHEYYHYLTNIITFPGVRQFQLNFCDRFRLLTIIANKSKLAGFPLNDNKIPECADEIEYWKHVNRIIEADDIDYKLVKEAEQSTTNKFEIVNINKEILSESFKIDGKEVPGKRVRISVQIEGIINRGSFELTYGAIDEFLSSAIDEFLFQYDLAEIDPNTLSSRPYYPYRLFDDLLKYYKIDNIEPFYKILLAYYSLNSFNPALSLIEVLESFLEGGYELFVLNPVEYLQTRYIAPNNVGIINQFRDFSEQCYQQGRIHMGQAMSYYGDRFYLAHQLKQEDLFYFIRPFFVRDTDKNRHKQKFLLALARIIQIFTPPVILKDKSFFYVDKLTTMGEATTHIIATYEIFESLKTNKYPIRPNYLKEKYSFPENNPNCDDMSKLTEPPIRGSYHIALNELNLYKLYYDLNNTPSSKGEK